MKLTRHNGRSGKNGTYNPRHNDRRFNVENSDHIDVERSGKNIYWDCYRGFTLAENRDKDNAADFTFEQIERAYYVEHYSDHVDAQNGRNEKSRHTERNRAVEDILKNNKTCPEESIYQIGTVEGSVPPEILFQIVNEFCGEFERRFGSHVHILDWALHLDEGTPHIHERHVFDCENRYGELCPQQEKALEKLDIPLPNPDKPKGRNNNRKQTFDAVCRTMLFDITRKYGLHLDMEPEYGGREYLEKQDYILMKHKEKIAEKEQAIGELTMKLDDVEQFIDEVTETAYEKAVEIVTDSVRAETQKADIAEIEAYKKWVTSPERKTPQDKKDFVGRCLTVLQESLRSKAQKIVGKVKLVLLNPKVRQENTDKIKEQARQSIKERLAEAKLEADRVNRERWEREGKTRERQKKNVEI